MKFNKNQLDALGTILGLISGVSTVLTTQGYLEKKLGGAISGVSLVFLGVVVQRPADSHPTTEDVEEKKQ